MKAPLIARNESRFFFLRLQALVEPVPEGFNLLDANLGKPVFSSQWETKAKSIDVEQILVSA